MDASDFIEKEVVMEKRLEKLEEMVVFLIARFLRLENKLGHSDVSNSMIYGLLNDVDPSCFNIGSEKKITKEKIEAVVSVINPIWNDKEKLKKITGYYDIDDRKVKNERGKEKEARR